MVRDEVVEVARGVREQADLETAIAQRVEHRQRVVVELEVHRLRPAPLHLDGGGVGVAGAAHADDDPLGEQHPDLLVVVELGMPFHLGEGLDARLVVAGGVEVEAVAEPERAVAVGAEVRAGPGDREIDVEDDCPQHAGEDRRGSSGGAGSTPSAEGGKREQSTSRLRDVLDDLPEGCVRRLARGVRPTAAPTASRRAGLVDELEVEERADRGLAVGELDGVAELPGLVAPACGRQQRLDDGRALAAAVLAAPTRRHRCLESVLEVPEAHAVVARERPLERVVVDADEQACPGARRRLR